jgi:hypothetical protein
VEQRARTGRRAGVRISAVGVQRQSIFPKYKGTKQESALTATRSLLKEGEDRRMSESWRCLKLNGRAGPRR